MKKKILAVLALAILLALSMAPAAWAVDKILVNVYAVEGGNIGYLDSDDGTCIIDGCEPAVTKANIPSTILHYGYPTKSLKVVGINFSAFAHCENLMEVIIPDSVTYIDDTAFGECSNLVKVNIPDSITSIGESVFSDCSSLNDIVIPNSVKIIGERSFYNCILLEKIDIPDSITSLSDDLFYGCENLTKVTLPVGLTRIGDAVFGDCSKLENIIIPDGVTDIGICAFMRCKSFTSITIPDGVKKIARETFFGCENLVEVSIPDSVESIDRMAFDDCYSLKTIKIPEKVTNIGYAAFGSCRILDGIVLPASVTNIEEKAFSGCRNLKDVYYTGTKEQWDNIKIDIDNEPLLNATIHYNSTGSEDVPGENITIKLYPENGKVMDLDNPANGTSSVNYADGKLRIFFDKELANSGGNRADLDFSIGTLEIRKYTDDSVVYAVKAAIDLPFWGENGVYNKAVLLEHATAELDYSTQYYVSMPAGFIKFADGTTSTAIAKGDWTFTTAEKTINFFSTKTDMKFQTGLKDSSKNPIAPYVTANWEDNWFVQSAKNYNHELARTAMALSGASYVEENGSPSSKTIVKALGDFEFDNIQSYNYSDSPGENRHYTKLTEDDNDHVSYTFGVKEIEYKPNKKFNLICIVVKGTSGNEEWYSNFNIGNGYDVHAGFVLAKGELTADLDKYIAENNLDGTTLKFLVTGHSRGAAVANMVAAQLNNSQRYDKENIFGYTFATPTVSTKATEVGYENIFNIISGEDFVTQVPLSNWGFRQFGVNLALPSKSYYGKDYDTIYKLMNKQYIELTQKSYQAFNNSTKSVDDLKYAVYSLAPTTNAFYNENHLAISVPPYLRLTTYAYFKNIADIIVESVVSAPIETLMMIASSNMTEFVDITNFFLIEHAMYGRVFSAHSMAGYYSWLNSCSTEELFGIANSSTYVTFKRITHKCPVDVYVYDANNNLVASVVNETIGENILAVNVDDGVKVIDLPNDQEYFIKIGAYDDGKMSYTVEEMSAEATGNTTLRTVQFNDIYIVNDDTFVGDVNNIMNTENKNYALTKNDGTVIYADYDSNSGNIDKPDNPSNPDEPSNPSRPSSGSSNHGSRGYAVFVNSVEGGKISVTPKTALKDDTVTINVTSNYGYKLDSLTVKDGSGKSVELTKVNDKKYTFVMPDSKVNVNAVFVKTETEKPSTTTDKAITADNINSVFADVKNNAWYSEAIAYVYNKGIMNGTEKGFEPDATTTRAMLVTMLHRLATNGSPATEGSWKGEPKDGALKFSDVAAGQWYSNAIAWAAANGVVNGYSETQFAPNAAITREQLAAVLYRFAQFKGYDVSVKGDLSSFSDSAKVSGWAQDAMKWAVGSGIINGDNNALKPAGNATRAEVAMMLMRFIEK